MASIQTDPISAGAVPARGGRVNRLYLLGIGGVHVLALLAAVPWLFSWTGVAVLVPGIVLFGTGINLGYHRILTHRSLRVPRWLERLLVVIALCCMQDGPVRWVTHHRAHHRYSDAPGDPHTPRAGGVRAHCGCLFRHNPAIEGAPAYQAYARDVLRDPFYRWLQKNPLGVYGIYAAHAVLFYAAGFAAGWLTQGSPAAGLQLGLSVLVWGVFVRTVIVWHITWSVNSLTHMIGYRNWDTPDDSRNNWLVGLLAVGEGWHNNHHADQTSACNWHRWWEVDLTWLLIRALEAVGLATEVVRPRHLRRSQPRGGAA